MILTWYEISSTETSDIIQRIFQINLLIDSAQALIDRKPTKKLPLLKA